MSDYETFHKMIKRFEPVGFELGDLVVNPPGGNLAASVRSQECMIRLGGTFDIVSAKVSHLSSLVGLAAKMVDSGDEFFVIGLLRIQLSGFFSSSCILSAGETGTAWRALCFRAVWSA